MIQHLIEFNPSECSRMEFNPNVSKLFQVIPKFVFSHSESFGTKPKMFGISFDEKRLKINPT